MSRKGKITTAETASFFKHTATRTEVEVKSKLKDENDSPEH